MAYNGEILTQGQCEIIWQCWVHYMINTGVCRGIKLSKLWNKCEISGSQWLQDEVQISHRGIPHGKAVLQACGAPAGLAANVFWFLHGVENIYFLAFKNREILNLKNWILHLC